MRLIDADELIKSIDINYYKQCNGVDMTECAADIKREVLQVMDKYKLRAKARRNTNE